MALFAEALKVLQAKGQVPSNIARHNVVNINCWLADRNLFPFTLLAPGRDR